MRVGDPHSPKKCLQVLLLSSKILPYLVCSNSSATWLLISCLVVLYCEKALSCCTLYRTEKNIKLATRTLERTRIHQRSAETCAHICGRFDSSKFPQKHQTKYISATRASKFSGSINLNFVRCNLASHQTSCEFQVFQASSVGKVAQPKRQHTQIIPWLVGSGIFCI